MKFRIIHKHRNRQIECETDNLCFQLMQRCLMDVWRCQFVPVEVIFQHAKSQKTCRLKKRIGGVCKAYTLGTELEKIQIIIYLQAFSNDGKNAYRRLVLEILAHEFGHAVHYADHPKTRVKGGSSNTITEQYANDYASRVLRDFLSRNKRS